MGNETEVNGYVDSDYAGSIDTRRSITGYAFTVLGGCVSWKSNLQKVVALSSTEAEYVGLSEVCSELRGIRMVMVDLKLKLKLVIVNEDNQSCISLANDFKLNPCTKHIEVKFHHVKELVRRKEIESTVEMVAA